MPRSIRVGDDTEAVYLAILADPAVPIIELDERTGLSVSLRTVRRMMSDLTERLGARSRFEAGLLAERRGWLRPPP